MSHAGLWILGTIAAILVAEVAAGRHRGIYDRNDARVMALCFVSGQAIRPVMMFLPAWLIGVLLPAGKGALHGVGFWPGLIGMLLVGEFTNYWVHRFAHEWKVRPWGEWLWRLHRTHHTAAYVNVLLNFRISLFWAFVSPLTWVSAVAIYLGLGPAALTATLIFSLWGITTHSHFRWDDPIRANRVFGPAFRALEHVFVSPGVHHSHHGYGRDGGNYRNFGIFLSVYDWMFGTLHIPQGRPSRYGIPDPSPHWAEEVFYPLYVKRGVDP